MPPSGDGYGKNCVWPSPCTNQAGRGARPDDRLASGAGGNHFNVSDTTSRSGATPHPWRWLLDLRDHLGPDIEVIDALGEPILPPADGEVAERLRRLLRPHRGPVPRAIVKSVPPGAPMAFAHTHGLRIGVLGVDDRSRARYTILLAERADAGRDSTRRAELTRIGAWLARAVLAASQDPMRDWRQITVLHQVLQKAVATGSVSSVLQAYVEALAIWSDMDTRAYIGDRSGRYVQEVALAGAVPADAPRTIAADALTAVGSMRRLTPDEARVLGFSPERDTMLSSIRVADHAPWVLSYTGDDRVSAEDESRVALFEEMLRPALQATVEVEASRLMWVLTQQLVDGPGSLIEAAEQALVELERAGLCTAAVLVLYSGDDVVLKLGVPAPTPTGPSSWPELAVLRFTLEVPVPFEGSLTLWRPPNRPFTQREARLGSIGSAVLGTWVSKAVAQRQLIPAAPAPTDAEHGAPIAPTVPDDVSADARADRRRPAPIRSEVSLLVVLPEPTETAADVRETWVRDIRRRLRPEDIVGALANGDISVMLPATAGADAKTVAERLSRLFTEEGALALLEGAPISIVSVGGISASR